MRHYKHSRNTVLAIDMNWRPMAEISRRKAIKAVVTRKADIINPKTMETSIFLEPGTPIKMIIYRMVLKTPGEPRLHSGNKGLKAILRRDGHLCSYCGVKVKGLNATVDHIMPKAQGGKTVWNNLTTACFKCNQAKAARTPEQANMPLRRRPTTPTMILMEKLHKLVESGMEF